MHSIIIYSPDFLPILASDALRKGPAALWWAARELDRLEAFNAALLAFLAGEDGM